MQDAGTELNKLKRDIESQLMSKHMRAQTVLKARLMVNFWQPLRVIINDRRLGSAADKMLGNEILDMNPYAIELKNIVNAGAVGVCKVLERGARVFEHDAERVYAIAAKYQESQSEVVDAIFALNEVEVEELIKEYAKAGFLKLAEHQLDFLKEHLEGGALANPTAELKKKLKGQSPHNDLCEGHYGLYDYVHSKRSPNTKQINVNAGTVWLSNKIAERSADETLLPTWAWLELVSFGNSKAEADLAYDAKTKSDDELAERTYQAVLRARKDESLVKKLTKQLQAMRDNGHTLCRTVAALDRAVHAKRIRSTTP